MDFKLIPLLCLVFATLTLRSQPNIEWQVCFGGTNSDHAHKIRQTPDGGYIVAGSTVSNNGDVFGNNGGADFWVLKTSHTGAVQWKKTYGGSNNEEAFSVDLTNDGGYIIVGHTLSNNLDVSGNHGYYDGWAVKIDGSGNIQWQRALGGSGWEEIWDVQQTEDGGYILAGWATSNDGDLTINQGSLDVWVVKLNSNGTLQWQKSFGGSSEDRGYSIIQTTDGGYLVGGESSSADGDATNNLGNSDYWVLKLNFEGKIEWQKSLGGASIDRANDVIEAADGGFVLFGQTYSTNGDVSGNHGNNDQWLVKLNKSGDLEWQKAFGGSNEEYATSIHRTMDGGYVMTGQTQSNNGDVVGNDGGADIWIVKTDALGVLQWQKTLGGTQAEWGNSVQQTIDNGFILAGYSWSNNGDVSGNKGKTDYWIVKLSPESSPTSAPAPLPLEISPNPAKNTISLKVPSQDKDLNILVTDLLGRELQQWSIPNPQSGSVALDIAAFPNGLYWVRVTTNSGAVYLGKVLKQG